MCTRLLPAASIMYYLPAFQTAHCQVRSTAPGFESSQVMRPCQLQQTLVGHALCCAGVCEQVGHRRDQYKRCAHLLEAVSQLLEHFSHYQDVPKIQSLTKRLTAVQVWSGARRHPVPVGNQQTKRSKGASVGAV